MLFVSPCKYDYYLIVGPLCEMSETEESESIRQRCEPYDAYISSLNSTCQPGQPGELIWTPDDNTPDLVYYQVSSPCNHECLILV